MMKSIRLSLYLVISLSILILFPQDNTAQTEAALVYPGEDGRLVYVKHANVEESNLDNMVIDYSHCGFMGGGVAIPDIPVMATVYPQFGDDQQRIQEAIDYVSGLEPDKNGYRGAVLLKAGTYELGNSLQSFNDALQIKTSGVVLRGEGQGPGGTILRTAYETKHQVIATRPQRPSIGTSNLTRIADPYVGSGVFGFHVEDASAYQAGDTIFVRFTPNQAWFDETYANAYMGDGDIDWDAGTYTIKYERIITNVEIDSITIHSPVIMPMQTSLGGGEIVKLSLSQERLNRVGVENMRLIGTGITPTCPADDPNRLQTAIHFEYTENSWIRDITVLHTSNSLFKMWDAHHVTIEDCASLDPLGPKRAGYRYTFYFDAASSHNLCQRTYTYDGRHDYVLGPRIPGPNVFLDGVSERGGTQGPHQRLATGTLFDNLKLQSLIALEHRNGSGSGHSWAGMQSTIWNTESPSVICDAPVGHMNYAIGNTGTEILSGYINNTQPGVYRGHYDSHGEHVVPRSLYLKQLEDRLGTSSVGNITIPEQLDGVIYDMIESWKGEGALEETGTASMVSPTDLTVSDLGTTEGSEYIEFQWTDNVPDETKFILERSADGGVTFTQVAELAANSKTFRDEDILQDTYHYRLKAVNDLLESGYVYLFADLFDEALYATVTFRVDMQEINDLFDGGDVWMVDHMDDARFEMTDEDTDSIYTLALSFMVGKNLAYSFAYQDGADSATNIVMETVTGDCLNSEGTRHLVVTSEDIVLPPNLFGSCDVALPDGTDVTDLEGTIIFGSNDDEQWIDAENGSGSPPNERVEKLIDNDIETKYLVRAVYSWVEIKTNRFVKLNGYTITSANDAPERDPRAWELRGWNRETETWETLHEVNNNPVWESRHKIRVWNIENDQWYHRHRLYIQGINGDIQGLMQMAELQLFGEAGDYTGTRNVTQDPAMVWPNPASDQLHMMWPVQGNVTVELYDVSGKKVLDKIHRDGSASSFSMDVSSLNAGMYILRLMNADEIVVKKILVDQH